MSHVPLFTVQTIYDLDGAFLANYFEMASESVNFISLVTFCVGLREEEPQTAHPMAYTWASHIAGSVFTGL